MRILNTHYRDRVLMPTLSPSSQALLQSQAGPHARAWLAAVPADQRAAADASPKLNTEHNELAASGSLELGVRAVFPVESLGEGEAGLAVNSRAGAAVTSDWVASTASWAPCQRKAVLDAAPVCRRHIEIQAPKGHICCDPCTRLFANASCRSLKQASTSGQRTDLGAGGAVVPKVVQEATASAVLGGQRERKPQPAKQ